MCCAAARLHLANKLNQGLRLKIATILNRKIDLPKIHSNNAPSADIRVTHFRITHLSAWQTGIRTMRDQLGRRAVAHNAIEVGGVCQSRRIGSRVIRQPPTIKNAQNDRFGDAHFRLSLWLLCLLRKAARQGKAKRGDMVILRGLMPLGRVARPASHGPACGARPSIQS